MARIVIADASPLIGLSIVKGLEWLPALFGEVWIPGEVCREVLSGKRARGEPEIQAALDAGWLRIWDQPFPALKGIDLDEGESACISIALHHPDPVLLIMDERAGRAVAMENRLQVIGTAAVIGRAKSSGLIPAARQVFEVLHQSDFRISPAVIKTVLARVGE
jgi:predicted nucleic acid-binding protein